MINKGSTSVFMLLIYPSYGILFYIDIFIHQLITLFCSNVIDDDGQMPIFCYDFNLLKYTI